MIPKCPHCAEPIERVAGSGSGYCCDGFKRDLEAMQVHEPRKLARRLAHLEAKVDAMAAVFDAGPRIISGAVPTTGKRRKRRTRDSAASDDA